MTRHFSIPTVLRMTPNALLRQCFAKFGYLFLEVPWLKLHKWEVTPILKVLQELPPDQQTAVETAMHNVHDLACEKGVDRILEAVADLSHGGPSPYLPDVGGPYCIAMWAWLHHPEVFDRALVLHQVDSLSRWRTRKDLPRVEPGTSGEALSRLANGLSELFRAEQGRGHRCTVEHVWRGDQTDYFFAYPDDFVQTVILHDDEGNLTPRCVRRTFEVVFAYSRAEGTLEMHAQVPTRLKPKLEALFCRTILREAPEPAERQVVYRLNALKDTVFQLPTDPEDGVDATVCRVRLRIPGREWNITLEPRHARSRDEVAAMVHECLDKEHVPLGKVHVSSVRIRLDFRSLNGRKPGSLTFDVTFPDLCSLRNQRPERVALAQKYLKRWRIAIA